MEKTSSKILYNSRYRCIYKSQKGVKYVKVNDIFVKIPKKLIGGGNIINREYYFPGDEIVQQDAIATLNNLAKNAKILVIGAQNINNGDTYGYGRYKLMNDFSRWSSIDPNYLGVTGMDPIWMSFMNKPVSAVLNRNERAVNWDDNNFWIEFDKIIKENRTPPSFHIIFIDRITLDYILDTEDVIDDKRILGISVLENIVKYLTDGGVLIVRRNELLKNAGYKDISSAYVNNVSKFTEIGLTKCSLIDIKTTTSAFEGEPSIIGLNGLKRPLIIECAIFIKNRDTFPEIIKNNMSIESICEYTPISLGGKNKK